MEDATDLPPAKQYIPEALRRQNRWCTWALTPHPVDGQPTKKPSGSTLDPSTRKPWAAVAHEPLSQSRGIGFIWTGGVHVEGLGWGFALDIDGCRCPATGALMDWATEVVQAFSNTFTEISPSGTGLHLFGFCKTKPPNIPKIYPPVEPPPGVDKRPEIQFFGAGSALYMTVTGALLPGCRTMLTGLRPEWLTERYAVTAPELADAEMPVGRGAPPAPQMIEQALRSEPELLAGDWRALDLPSASEAWFRLVKHAVHAAGGHGAAAADFLLQHTPWGEGLIDSRDPGKYARPGWVRQDVARIAAKVKLREGVNLEKAFKEILPGAPLPGGREPAPQASPEPTDGDPWSLPFGEYVAKAAQALPFLVHDFLPAEGLAEFFGDPSCGKTPCALSLALHVAAGRPKWLGFDIDAPGPVLYMVGEGGPGLGNRLRAQAQADGMAHDALGDFHASTRPGALSDTDNRQAWAKWIKGRIGASIKLLVVDTLNMNFGPGNESATEDMTTFVHQLKALSLELRCLVLLVHHTGHKDKGRSRGSSVLVGALDAEVEISREGRAVTLNQTKAKDWQEADPVQAHLRPVELGRDDRGRPITAITLRSGTVSVEEAFGGEPPPDDLTNLLRAIAYQGDTPLSQTALADLANVSRRIVRKLIEQAEGLGLVKRKNIKAKNRTSSYLLTEKAHIGWPDLAGQPTNSRIHELLK